MSNIENQNIEVNETPETSSPEQGVDMNDRVEATGQATNDVWDDSVGDLPDQDYDPGLTGDFNNAAATEIPNVKDDFNNAATTEIPNAKDDFNEAAGSETSDTTDSYNNNFERDDWNPPGPDL